MKSIQYKPLDKSKTEIRLIELLPRSSKSCPQGRLPRCNLIYASLDHQPEYAALSYTWGSPSDRETIIVDDNLVSVTRNLHSALQHLQYETTARTIWIDALCINQSDNEEKGWQVQLMREIYEHATFVTVWLGPADSTSDEVMDFMKELGKKAIGFGLDGGPGLIRNVSEQWRELSPHPPAPWDDDGQRIIVKPPNGIGESLEFALADLNKLYYSISGSHERDHLFPVDGMANLFKRSWWGRIWVLQELSLAQKANFICGTKRISRRQLTAALNAFKALAFVFQETTILEGSKNTPYRRSVAQAAFDQRPTVLLSMWNTYRESPFPLLALLRSTCTQGLAPSTQAITFEATDPRDKIYGLLGLAADRDQLKEFGLVPDYTLSYQEVYMSVAAALLRQGHLSILPFAQFSAAQLDLPSWVPDWSKPLGDNLQGTTTDQMTPDPPYNASGSVPSKEPVFSGIGAEMSVSISGFIYDEVQDLGASWAEVLSKQALVSPLQVAKMFLEELLRLTSLRGKGIGTLKERIASATRTAAGGIGYNDNGRWARIGNQRYHTAVSLLMMRIDTSPAMEFPNFELRKLVKEDKIQPTLDELVAGRYLGDIFAKSAQRRPFLTAKGHLSLGPDDIKRGDAIAIFLGIQVPFVLRKSRDNKYRVVGEAYVDGIMDGEVMAGRERIGVVELL